MTDPENAGSDRSHSGRFGLECECGRVVSIYDREYHRNVECPVHADDGLRADGGPEQYEDALCPGCGVVLTGSREPGDEGHCQETDSEVTFVEAKELGDLIDGELDTESPYGDTPEDDVACADCGRYELLVGGLNQHGEIVEYGDFVCRRCARKRALSTEEER